MGVAELETMTSQQKIDLTLRAALMVQEASGLINCSDPYLIRMLIHEVAMKLKDLEARAEEYSKTVMPKVKP